LNGWSALWMLPLLAWSGMSHGASPSPACTLLSPRSAIYQDALIEAPGAYCLASDLRQQAMSGAGHSGPGYDHALVTLKGGDVVIDLQGHTLRADARSHGVLAQALANLGTAERQHREYGSQTRSVTVRNGVIDLRGIGSGIRFIRWWELIQLEETVPPAAAPYEQTRFVIENLTIKTDNVGIQLEGEGNIVRHCVIESGGNAAIMLAGPHSLIEDNTIILGDRLVPTWLAASADTSGVLLKAAAERRRTRAAIVLQDGSGSVIRGNRIEVRGKSATRHSIYLNNGSRDVLVEDNNFVDGVDPVVQLNGSNARLARNELKR